MSSIHSYRVQLHCDDYTYTAIKDLARQRGLSQSLAARMLVEQALSDNSALVEQRLNRMENRLEAILHAATAARVLATEAAQAAGANPTNDELRERIDKLIARYLQS